MTSGKALSAPARSTGVLRRCLPETVLKALVDFFTTDYGLMSAFVIAFTIGMGVFFSRFIARNMKADAERAARENRR